jgi:hypothetical protein
LDRCLVSTKSNGSTGYSAIFELGNRKLDGGL